MTAVPPPVPPEILRRAAEAVAAYFHYDEDENDLGLAEVYIAAVYGDIVEAARRDALDQAVAAIRGVAAEWADVDPYNPAPDALADALRVVTDLRDATAPPSAPSPAMTVYARDIARALDADGRPPTE